MEYSYIIEKKYLDQLNLIEDNVVIEEINNHYGIYYNLIKIYSPVYLELDDSQVYHPFIIMINDRESKENLNLIQNEYISSVTGNKNITSTVVKKNNNYYIYFYTQGLILYLKPEIRDQILLGSNKFKDKHYYYGYGDSISYILSKKGINFNNIEEINYGEKKLTIAEKKELMEKKIISHCNLELYMPIKKKGEFYHYRDKEDVKNILNIEEGLLPRHKVLKKDKIKLLQILQESNLINCIKDYNKLLADNELIYGDKKMLTKLSQKFYKGDIEKYQKKIFNDLDKAVCSFLNTRISNNKGLLISEKDQYVLYYTGQLGNLDDNKCKEYIINILRKKNIEEDVSNMSLTQLANLIIYKDQLIFSNEDNPVFLDQDDKNMPLHIIINHGQHHHGYYDNGIFPGILKDENFNIKITELVNFIFTSVDNNNHTEVSVVYKDKEKILDKYFYLPGKYYDLMNKKLKILFSLGLMLTNFDIVKWNKENILDIKSIFMPPFIKNVTKIKEKELFKFLLQI